MKRTDIYKICYPVGLTSADRRFIRKFIIAVAEVAGEAKHVIVSCSGGIDSTVLVHALGQATTKLLDSKVETTAVYLNHHLRLDEVQSESLHVEEIARKYLSYVTPSISLKIEKGNSLQNKAREARYSALSLIEKSIRLEEENPKAVIQIMTAHHRDDDAETRIFQFLRGKKVTGIPQIRPLNKNSDGPTFVVRPLLKFSREDIVRYAKCFGLVWMEDSSNIKDVYTRNKIRHNLLPWIKEHINPGVVKTLTREYKQVD